MAYALYKSRFLHKSTGTLGCCGTIASMLYKFQIAAVISLTKFESNWTICFSFVIVQLAYYFSTYSKQSRMHRQFSIYIQRDRTGKQYLKLGSQQKEKLTELQVLSGMHELELLVASHHHLTAEETKNFLTSN